MIEIQELTDEHAKFIMMGVDISIVNALRRTLLTDIPKMAIDDVGFPLGPIRDKEGQDYESISPLFDEVIAHRLGLLPIPTDLSLFNFRENCVCDGEGCPSCAIKYTLYKLGPCTVYSGDLQPFGDEKFKIRDDRIQIVKLGEEQALLIEATAVLGTAKQHAKWQVAHAVTYRYYPQITLNLDKCNNCGDCIAACHRTVFGMNTQGKLELKNIGVCDLCRKCEGLCEKNAITVDYDENKFMFKFETDSTLTAKEAFLKALTILKAKITGFEKALKGLEPSAKK